MRRVGVNGAGGRIGVLATYFLHRDPAVKLATLNAPSGIDSLVQELAGADPVRGTLDWDVRQDGGDVFIDEVRVPVQSARNPKDLDLEGIDVFAECSGFYKGREEGVRKAQAFLERGAGIVVQAYSDAHADAELIMGVNEYLYRPDMTIISNSSCTTKAAALPLHILTEQGLHVHSNHIVTPHAQTNSQDPDRARDQILTYTTGAAKALNRIFPTIKTTGQAFRAPTSNGSFATLNLIVVSDEELTAERVNQTLLDAARNPRYAGRLGVIADGRKKRDYGTREAVVGRPEDSLLFPELTHVHPALPLAEGRAQQVAITVGYDNERGPARNLAELCGYVASRRKQTIPA